MVFHWELNHVNCLISFPCLVNIGVTLITVMINHGRLHIWLKEKHIFNANDRSCGKAFFSMHLVMLLWCLTHKCSVFSKAEEDITEEIWWTDSHSQCGRCWCVLILTETFEHANISQTLILLCGNESVSMIPLINEAKVHYGMHRSDCGDLSFQNS